MHMNDSEIGQAALSFISRMKDIPNWKFEKVEIPGEIAYYSTFVGNLLDINPSGKYYTSLTTNQNQNDIDSDLLFWKIVIQGLSDLDMWTEQGKGDALDTFLCKWEVKNE